jgi:hypothetical protein
LQLSEVGFHAGVAADGIDLAPTIYGNEAAPVIFGERKPAVFERYFECCAFA